MPTSHNPHYTTGWKIVMSAAALAVGLLAYPFLSFGIFMLSHATLLSTLYGAVVLSLGIGIAAWAVIAVYRTWSGRWPFLKKGDHLVFA